MAVSIVRGPDGRQHKVQHPDGIASSQIIKYAQREIASVANAEDSFVVDVGKGLFTGGSQAAVSSAAGVTQWMGQSFGSDSLLQAAEDMRQYSQGIGDQVGLDEDFRESFFGQVVQGLGQVPVTIGAGAVGLAVAGPVGMYGAAALTTGGQMTSEFLTDMEQTIGKQYTNFNGSEKEAALKGMLAQTALGTTLELAAVGKAVRPLLRRLNTKGVSAKALKKAIEQDKSALREIVESGLAEGFTEASQGQSLDTLASMLYDEDRELITMDTLKRRSLEFGVGAVVGGTVSAGAQILGSPGKTSTTNKDLGKPVEGRSEVSVPREIEVTYKPVDGPTTTIILAPNEGESAIDAAERILEGRRLPGSDMTVNEVIEQTPIDVVLGEPDAEILEEDVPVDSVPVEQAPDPIGDRRFEDNVAVEESDYILPDVELDDIARLDVGQMSDEELQKLIESYNKYNGEGDRVRNLDELQNYAEIFNRELEGDLSEAEVQAEIDKDNKKYNAERKRIARAIKERDARARGEASQLSEADFDALAEEAQKKRGRGRTQTPTPAPVLEPSVETAPESAPDPTVGKTVTELAQEVGITEQQFRETYPDLSRRADERARSTEAEVDPRTGLPGFSLPQNLKKGKPGYRQTQGITFASDLERAAYSATTSTRSEPGKRKRDSYRKLLQDTGYSSTEINTMGREVRSQMRSQYTGPDSELSVALPQDVVAQAAPLEISQVSDENNSLRIGTALQKGKNTTTPEDNVSPDRITPANLKKQMAKMTHFVKKIVKDGKEKGRDVKFPKWMRAKGGAKAQSEAFIKQFKDNLIALHNSFPEEYRARATQWYDGARKIVDRAAEQTGLTPEQVAGVMAALSPLKDWFQNVQMGLNLVDVATNNSDDVFTQAKYKDAINIVLNQSSDNTVKNQRKKLFKLLEGKTIRELFNQGTKESKQLAAWAARIISTSKHGFYHDVLSPEGNSLGIRRNKDGGPKAMVWQSIPFIVKSLDIVYDGSVENISNQLGKKHKIRNFYNNIIAPNSPYGDATIDTHAVNATTLFPMGGSGYQADLNFGKAGVGGGGVSGTYWLHLEAYKQAAKEVGIQPRQMQSITWEAIRMLFPDVDKRDQKFIDKYENIWNNSTDAETTRQQILSEGIEPPEWATYRPRPLRGAEAVEASVRENARPKVEPTRSVQADDGPTSRGDVTAQAAETAAEDRGPQDTFENGSQVMDFIEKSFNPIAEKLGLAIRPAMRTDYVAQYNVTQKVIEYNPMALLNRSKAGIQAAMREEIIHAAMHNVLIQKEKKARTGRSEDALWIDFFTALGNNLTPQERTEIQNVYQSLQEGDTVGFGSEYSRAVVQKFRYGDFSEQYVMPDKGGPAFQAIVDLLRSVQAYMAKVLGPMVKTDPEAAQVIVDTVELLNAIDPAIRPKSQQVVANAYNATDKNTAQENTDPGESVDSKASERIREERKWFADSSLRKTASKFLTPVITRLNRINPMFGRMLQQLDTSIRERSFRHQKQTKAFFNKLNAIKGAEFLEMKQLLFFSPTPEEATHPINKAKMQRRDALLHKYGLLNMYRLDVQPIMEEIYAEYTKLGMPAMGYLEDYFPRVVKDLEGLINSYGQKSKRTFELLVREENERRSALKDKDGNDASLPEMNDTERARFFQDFLQNKFRVDINGARLPGNVKVRDIQLIPEDKLKFYDDPGIAFGKYTANMNRAIESFKVVGDTRKGRLQGELGKLTEELFSAGQIDNADADTVKSLTELITTQFQAENEILKSLGTLTYMATLINPGPVLVQIMDLYKVALYRGLGGVVSGVYRTVTGNRRFDLEDDLSISKTQLSAEFQDSSVLQKALDFGLSRLVPFRQMDTAMKHASIEAAYDDFAKKAKAPVGSKKYEQLLSELTITMGREDALKTIGDLKLGKAMESPLVKEALLAELLQRQPLTYLQVPEGYQTDPSKRLFYKLSTFMLLDLNYNRQEFMNDLGGPGKTLQQRTVALRRLTYMATLLTMFGLPSDLLDDWISGKDTYIPEHVMNNMLGMFGLSKYTTTRALEKGTVESVIQRFTPPAVNIIVKGEESLRSWVKGDVELFEMKAWRNSPLSDVWYNRTGAGKKQQEKLQKLRRKEGVRPSIDRS